MNLISKIFLSVIFIYTIHNVHAQAPQQLNSAEIYQNLQKLNTLGTVLYVAAHPDDENTRLMSWLVGDQKFRTAYVSLTRGDGGQNLIGNELGTSLGAIRTQELLAARKIDGAEQYFTRAYDFGFSKNPEETLQKWNEDSLLQDLVVLIRKIRPDVMICRFPTTGEGGHGHHTASAILGRKAFVLAGDESYKVPNNLPAWKVKKLFWNTFSFGTTNTISEDQLKLDVGTFNKVLGKSYGEISSLSRSQHKSQGFGTASTRGTSKEYFLQWEGDSAKENIFDGINTTWNRIPRSENIQKLLNSAISKYNLQQPSTILPELLAVRKAIEDLQLTREYNLEKEVWVRYQLIQLEKLIAQCAGIWSVASVNTNELSPNDTFNLKLQFIHRSDFPIKLKNIKIGEKVISIDTITANNQLFEIEQKISVPENTPFSAPYWLEQAIQNNLFHPVKDHNGNQAFIKDDQFVTIGFEIFQQLFQLKLPLNNRYTDPVKGEIFEPVVILPAVTMHWSSSFSIHPNGKSQKLQLQVTAHTDISGGKLNLKIPKNWTVSILNKENLPELKKGQTHTFDLEIKSISANNLSVTLFASIDVGNKNYTQQLTNIDYPHIPRQTILTTSEVLLVSFPVQMKAHKIGYIEGAGDLVASSLTQLGYDVVLINEKNYHEIGWKNLDAVVTGIRAYNTHLWLNDAYDSLMKYVENGGNLIVQYNTNNRLGPIIAKMFPYDLEITRDRVTVEEAPVKFVDSSSVILNSPNKIDSKDFESWIQERGIYFAGKRDASWKSPIAMNDPGETSNDGSIVVAQYGKGNLVYTGLSFFRELPAGVTGAYRLLVNMIEIPQNNK
jgi:LmbE family N-acetylglucosaminyl deacetylase